MPEGLFLAEASHGDIRTYIDKNNHLVLRKKWCHQVAESVAYLDRHCVIHSDLHPGKSWFMQRHPAHPASGFAILADLCAKILD
jgi:hypothetical protein